MDGHRQIPIEVHSRNEVGFWNWGGFGFTIIGLGFIWAWSMRLWWQGAVCLVMLLLFPFLALTDFSGLPAFVCICLSIYLGLNGSRLAWESRRFISVRDFQYIQTAWGWWSLGVGIVWSLFSMILIATFIMTKIFQEFTAKAY
jgi:hypothetical protein